MQIPQSKKKTLEAQMQIAQSKKIYEKHKRKLRKQKKSGKAQFKFRNCAICEICALVCAYLSSDSHTGSHQLSCQIYILLHV